MGDHHDDVDAEYHKTADPGVGWAKKAKAWLDKFDEVTHKQIISDWENLLMWPIETSLEVKRSPKTNLTVKKVKVNEWCPSKKVKVKWAVALRKVKVKAAVALKSCQGGLGLFMLNLSQCHLTRKYFLRLWRHIIFFLYARIWGDGGNSPSSAHIFALIT